MSACATDKMPQDKAAEGWFCKREAGHEGPCAAVQLDPLEHQFPLLAVIREGQRQQQETLEEIRDALRDLRRDLTPALEQWMSKQV